METARIVTIFIAAALMTASLVLWWRGGDDASNKRRGVSRACGIAAAVAWLAWIGMVIAS